MTTLPRELARKQPANLPVQPAPTVINGHVVRKDTGARIAGLLFTVMLAVIFAGFLLSTV